MNIKTTRSPRGKIIHIVRGEALPVTSTTAMAETYCGKEFSGLVDYDDTTDSVTCAKCTKLFEESIAIVGEPILDLTAPMPPAEPVEPSLAEMTREAIETMQRVVPEPPAAPVLASPEVTREPRRYDSPGRARHGRIRYERSERRRQMKAQVR